MIRPLSSAPASAEHDEQICTQVRSILSAADDIISGPVPALVTDHPANWTAAAERMGHEAVGLRGACRETPHVGVTAHLTALTGVFRGMEEMLQVAARNWGRQGMRG